MNNQKFFKNVFTQHTSGLQRLAGIYDPPQSCDIPINAESYGDCDGGDGETGSG